MTDVVWGGSTPNAAPELGDAAIAPLERSETLSQRAARLVRTRIVEGALPAGSMLTVPSIAKTCGVSATPVREALIHLSEAGLVTMERGRITIAEPTERALREAFEVREALEGMSARLAAERRGDDDLRRIHLHAKQSLERARAGDAKAFRTHDAEFHRAVGEGSGSKQLVRYLGNALDLAQTLRNIRVLGEAFTADSAGVHINVATAIEECDADRAEAEMRRHIRAVLEQLLHPSTTESPGS